MPRLGARATTRPRARRRRGAPFKGRVEPLAFRRQPSAGESTELLREICLVQRSSVEREGDLRSRRRGPGAQSYSLESGRRRRRWARPRSRRATRFHPSATGWARLGRLRLGAGPESSPAPIAAALFSGQPGRRRPAETGLAQSLCLRRACDDALTLGAVDPTEASPQAKVEGIGAVGGGTIVVGVLPRLSKCRRPAQHRRLPGHSAPSRRFSPLRMSGRQYPTTWPSLRTSVPPCSMPVSGLIRMAW